MALGLSTGSAGGGEIQPFVKYDAKAGRLFRVDRAQGSDGAWATNNVEITNVAQMVIDLSNIRVGWINYTSQGPVRRLVVLGKEPLPARPDDKDTQGKLVFKQGFEVDLMLNKDAGGGPVRLLGSTAGCVIEAMDALHDAYSNAAEAKAGKLPIVKITDVQPVKSGQATNYKPTFSIINWIDRPAAFAGATKAASAQANTPPATGSTVVPPPPQFVPQQAPAMAGAQDFG